MNSAMNCVLHSENVRAPLQAIIHLTDEQMS
jgi:hypothetical protein